MTAARSSWLLAIVGALSSLACPVDDRLLSAAKLDEEGAGADGSTTAGAGGDGGDDAGGTGADGAGAGGIGAGGSGGEESPSSGGAPTGNAGDGNPSGGAPPTGNGGEGATGPMAEVCKEDVNVNGVFDCEENLLENGTFDADFSEWVNEVGVTISRDADNAPGNGAGSLVVTNSTSSSSSSYTMAGAVQCVAIDAESAYQLLAKAYLADGALGTAGLSVWFYSGGTCNGSLLLALSVPQSGITGQWSTLSKDFTSPAGASSMAVRVVAVKKYNDPALTVRFDNVFVTSL
jgi:hypothetical protein